MYIAIASHNRTKQLQEKTLALLIEHNFDMAKVYVFVAPSSFDDYVPVSMGYGFKLVKVPGEECILTSRNYIIQYFDEDDHIVEMDDDIEDIMTTLKGVRNESVGDLKQLFEESFDLLEGSGLWGFNANTNNFFADGKDKFGLYSIINSCCGYINSKIIRLTVSEKEDFERCLLFMKLDHPILKRCGYGIKTKYWINKGGIKDRYDYKTRMKVQADSAATLMKKYPSYCYTHTRKSGLVDIRFRRINWLKDWAASPGSPISKLMLEKF